MSRIKPTIAVCCLTFLTAICYALPNRFIARMNEPGSFFLLTFQWGDDEDWSEPNHLTIVSDYGNTVDPIRNQIQYIKYHKELNVLSHAMIRQGSLFLSNDSGYSSIGIGDYPVGYDFAWLPIQDSLVAVRYHMSYSHDTCQTWLNDARGAGLHDEGISTGTYNLGWSGGDYATFSGFESPQGLDSMGFFFSDSYCDTFEVMSYSDRFDYGKLNLGFSPGEYYYQSFFDYAPDTLFFTTDTGRTWQVSGFVPTFYGGFWHSELEAGWRPGETIWYGCYFDPFYTDTTHYELYIYHSLDYCQSWNLLYHTPSYYEQNPDSIVIRGSLESYEILPDTFTNVSRIDTLYFDVTDVAWTHPVIEPEQYNVTIDWMLLREDSTLLDISFSENAFSEAGIIEGTIYLEMIFSHRMYMPVYVQVPVRGYLYPSNYDDDPAYIEVTGTTEAVAETADTLYNRSPVDTLLLSIDAIQWTGILPDEGSYEPSIDTLLPPGGQGLLRLNLSSDAFSDTGNVTGVVRLSTNSLLTPEIEVPVQGHIDPVDSTPESRQENSPSTFAILSTWPNPFNSTLTVSFSLPQDGDVSFALYNVLGRRVFEECRFFSQGYQTIQVECENNRILRGSGIYFVTIKNNGVTLSKKVILLK